MANFVTNRIKFFGHQQIDHLVLEIKKRIREDMSRTNEMQDLSLVERIFYGEDHNDIEWSNNNIGGKWIYTTQDGDDDELVFVTGWAPAFRFQDHLLKCVSKIDPKVVVRLDYDDEMPNFVGARYVLFDKGEIVEFHNELDTDEYTVVMEDDVESTKEELREQDEDDSNVIHWGDLWSFLNDQKRLSLDEMKSEYKYTKNIKDSY
jgi:uncharacterized protein (UPF0248 family)